MPDGICAVVEHCMDDGCQAGTNVIYEAGYRAGMKAAALTRARIVYVGSVGVADPTSSCNSPTPTSCAVRSGRRCASSGGASWAKGRSSDARLA